MTAVDVLAAWDELLAFASRGVERDDPAREMIEAGYEARTAMAELIETDVEYDAALAAIEEHHRSVAHMGYVDVAFSFTRQLAERLVRAQMARHAALARCKGKGA